MKHRVPWLWIFSANVQSLGVCYSSLLTVRCEYVFNERPLSTRTPVFAVARVWQKICVCLHRHFKYLRHKAQTMAQLYRRLCKCVVVCILQQRPFPHGLPASGRTGRHPPLPHQETLLRLSLQSVHSRSCAVSAPPTAAGCGSERLQARVKRKGKIGREGDPSNTRIHSTGAS